MPFLIVSPYRFTNNGNLMFHGVVRRHGSARFSWRQSCPDECCENHYRRAPLVGWVDVARALPAAVEANEMPEVKCSRYTTARRSVTGDQNRQGVLLL